MGFFDHDDSNERQAYESLERGDRQAKTSHEVSLAPITDSR
jgi:hypothetical protein